MPIVDIQALGGYDRIKTISSKIKKLQANAGRTCSYLDCSIKLSMYNQTDFCSKHERHTPISIKNI
jgi:hypothetical protein